MFENLNSGAGKMRNVEVRIRQQFYKNKTNYPFLSGDSFSKACDFSFDTRTQKLENCLDSAKSIFCPSDKLEQFLEIHWDQVTAAVLVLGNSDRNFYEFPWDLPSSIKSVYLQNSHISDQFFNTLPIGLENLRYGRNGIPALFFLPPESIDKKKMILIGPFSNTHTERQELEKWKHIRNAKIQVISQRLQPRKLARIATQYKFVACPRGNGTDTHRFWETLYRGSIPVVKRDRWSESISNLGIPIIQLSTWDLDEFLEASSFMEEVTFNPKEIPMLWMDYWENAFNSKVK
jgi:hypothetical protein